MKLSIPSDFVSKHQRIEKRFKFFDSMFSAGLLFMIFAVVFTGAGILVLRYDEIQFEKTNDILNIKGSDSYGDRETYIDSSIERASVYRK